MTKEFIDSIVKQLKEYVDAKLRGWGLSDEEKSLVAFEQKHMPYTQYSGNQSIDHVLFRKFLRLFDPEDIRNNLANHKQDKFDEALETEDTSIVGAINEVKQKALDDYGPYENMTLEAVATMLHDRLTLGKTIGVIEDGYVVEYWWQPKDEGIKFISKNGNEIKCERDQEQDRDGYIAWVNYSKYGFPEYYYTKEDSPEVFMYRQVIGDFPITADSYETIIIYGFVKKAAGDVDQEQLDLKQDKTDSSLNTTNKTIVGAINELNSRAESLGEDVAALQEQIGSAGEITPAFTDVSLFATTQQGRFDDSVFVKAPAGMLKETDQVIFARYISNKTRPRLDGMTDKSIPRSVYRGWIKPAKGGKHNSPLFIPDDKLKLIYHTTIDGYDHFYLQVDPDSDDEPLLFYLWEYAFVSEDGHRHPRVKDKKLGIKIVRDGKTIVDYLPFTIKVDNDGNVHFGRL